MREGRTGLPTPARILAKEGVRIQLGHIITQLARTHVKERARASWLVPTTTMESAMDSAVSKVALETFEAEAREAIAAFVCGTTFSYHYRLGKENRSPTSY